MTKPTNKQLQETVDLQDQTITELHAQIAALKDDCDQAMVDEVQSLSERNAALQSDLDALLDSDGASSIANLDGITVIDKASGEPIAIVQLLAEDSLLTVGNKINLGNATAKQAEPEPDPQDNS